MPPQQDLLASPSLSSITLTDKESQPDIEEKKVEDGPDGGYGWVIATSVGIINANSWGINSAFAVFLAFYLSNDILPGATPLEYAFVGSLGVGLAMLLSPFVTMAVSRFGTKHVMLCGALVQSISLVTASLSTTIAQLFFTQGVIFGLAMAMLFIPTHGLVAKWFTRRHALANGIALMGAGLGGVIYTLGTGAMIRNLGLAWAFRILSIVTFVANATSILLIKDRPEQADVHQLSLNLALLKRIEYLLVLAFSFFSILGYFVLVYTLANYANEIGLNAAQASLIPALFHLSQAICRPFLGYFCDTWGRINVATILTLFIGIFSLAIWVNADSNGVLMFFALIEGTIAGVFWIIAAPIFKEVIGTQNLDSGLSIMWVVLSVPATFSAPIALQIATSTGSYFGAQLFTGFSFVLAALFLGILRGWKISLLGTYPACVVSKCQDEKCKGSEHKDTSTGVVANCFRWAKV